MEMDHGWPKLVELQWWLSVPDQLGEIYPLVVYQKDDRYRLDLALSYTT
jgi:hypothetical protein